MGTKYVLEILLSESATSTTQVASPSMTGTLIRSENLVKLRHIPEAAFQDKGDVISLGIEEGPITTCT